MSIGVPEVIGILVIVLILFGAGKLPRVMGDLAKGIKNFKAGMKDETDSTKVAATASRDSGDAEVDQDSTAKN